jgi:hypothetical protein
MAKKMGPPRVYHATVAVRELARIAGKLRKIESSADFVHQGQRITLSLTIENEGALLIRTSLDEQGSLGNANTIQDQMQRLLDAHLHAALVPDSVTVRTSSEADLSPAGMRDLLRRIWCHAGGVNPDAPAKTARAAVSFDAFMAFVKEKADAGKLTRALDMLKEERFQLYTKIETHQLVGIVGSQKKEDLIYSCHLSARGRYGCCTPDLVPCWGMRGELCKHLLVLIIGLTKGGAVEAATMKEWVGAVGSKGPYLHEELVSDTLLMHKGAEAGEIDWRPTETIPEDYFAY